MLPLDFSHNLQLSITATTTMTTMIVKPRKDAGEHHCKLSLKLCHKRKIVPPSDASMNDQLQSAPKKALKLQNASYNLQVSNVSSST
jgi:hypothetical protein